MTTTTTALREHVGTHLEVFLSLPFSLCLGGTAHFTRSHLKHACLDVSVLCPPKKVFDVEAVLIGLHRYCPDAATVTRHLKEIIITYSSRQGLGT